MVVSKRFLKVNLLSNIEPVYVKVSVKVYVKVSL